MYTAFVITVSDRCAAGQRSDRSGPAVVSMLTEAGYTVTGTRIVPDDRLKIEEALLEAAADGNTLILTTGGTGFSPRDITPEATAAVCQRLVPGIPEAMRAASMAITPRAMLSRAAAGILDKSLIVNLPGSPNAAVENLNAVLPHMCHGLKMLLGDGSADCAAKEDG